MNIPTTTANSTFSSPAPCSPDEVATSSGDCVEKGVEKWLEDEALPGFRVWQLAGIVLSIVLALIVALCCCIKFRIPRTKQDIEADYIRKRITKNFRKELSYIDNTEMDEMDLRKDVECEELQKQQEDVREDHSSDGLRARFRAMVHGMRTRFSKDPLPAESKIRELGDNEV